MKTTLETFKKHYTSEGNRKQCSEWILWRLVFDELSFSKQYFFLGITASKFFLFISAQASVIIALNFFRSVPNCHKLMNFDQRRRIRLSSNLRLFVSQWQALLTVPLSLEDQCVHSKYKANEIISHFLLIYKFSTLNWVSTLKISKVSSVVDPLKNSYILSIYSLVFCCCVLRSTASPLNSNFLILADWCSAWKWFFYWSVTLQSLLLKCCPTCYTPADLIVKFRISFLRKRKQPNFSILRTQNKLSEYLKVLTLGATSSAWSVRVISQGKCKFSESSMVSSFSILVSLLMLQRFDNLTGTKYVLTLRNHGSII